MLRVETPQMTARCILLCLLCFGSVFSASTETAQTAGADEVEIIYGENKVNYDQDEDVLRFDFFPYTTRKRYIWEDDEDEPTVGPGDGAPSQATTDFMLYVFIPIMVVALVLAYVYVCYKKMKDNNCCSVEYDSEPRISADIFTTAHRPPVRRAQISAQVHRPPRERNNYLDSRRELLGESGRIDFSSQRDRNLGTTDSRDATISFVNSPYASASQSRTWEPDTVLAEKPPDYSTVTLSDLVNPNKPSFPVVKKDNETPPPEYGKENPLFR